VNCSLVSLLVECLTKDVWACANLTVDATSLIPEVVQLTDRTPSHYATVFNPYLRQLTPRIIHDFVFYHNAVNKGQNVTCTSDADCQGPISACIAQQCFESWTFYHDALPTSFQKNLDTDAWEIVDQTAPNWAEPMCVWCISGRRCLI
jgi:hypothetical protein